MGDGRRAVVVVIAARVYNSFSIVFVTIRENKRHTYRLEGAMPLSPSPFSSVLLPLLPPLVLLLLLLAGRSGCGGCGVVAGLKWGGEGLVDAGTQPRRCS